MTRARSGPSLNRRALAGIIVLAVALAAMILAAALPHLWTQVTEDSIAQLEADVKLLEARLGKRPGVSRAGLTEGDDVRPVFLSGSTPGLGHAALQRLVDRLAEDSGLGVARIQPLQSDEVDRLVTLRMEVEATGSIASLREFLVALEAGTPLVFVSAARVAPGRPAEEDSAALPSDFLNVSLQLEAFAWREIP